CSGRIWSSGVSWTEDRSLRGSVSGYDRKTRGDGTQNRNEVFTVNEIIYARLTQAAREKKFVSYSDLSAAIQLSLTDAAGVSALHVILNTSRQMEKCFATPRDRLRPFEWRRDMGDR